MARSIDSDSVALTALFDRCNVGLFGGGLPPAVVIVQRKRSAHGYFRARQFDRRGGARVLDEVALNPTTFRGRTDREIVSTLVHEMVHLWQFHFGKPGRRGYHNRQWARKMIEVGLQPSDTGKPNGKQTGEWVSHYVLPGGAFARLWPTLQADDLRLRWQARKAPPAEQTRVRFWCSSCDQKAWAVSTVLLLCGRPGCNQCPMTMDGPVRRVRDSV